MSVFHITLIEYLSSCFSCVLRQNKGDAQKVESGLLNIVSHAYGEHDNCQEWCKNKILGNLYKHEHLPNGQPLTDPELRVSLTQLLTRFAGNASKLAPCGSSQANESFNNIVASKHPKSKHYAGS